MTILGEIIYRVGSREASGHSYSFWTFNKGPLLVPNM